MSGNKIGTLGTFDSNCFESIDLRGNPLSCINVPDNLRHDPCESGQSPTASPTAREQPPPPLTVVTNEDGTMIVVFGTCGAGGVGLLVTLFTTAVWLYRRGLLPACISNVVRRATERNEAERPPSEAASDWTESEVGGEPMMIELYIIRRKRGHYKHWHQIGICSYMRRGERV